MPLEIECKVRVSGHGPVRKALKRAGAEFVLLFLESNELFDRPEGTLRAAGSGLRIRSMRPLDAADRGAGADSRGSGASAEMAPTMTFKGPRRPGAYKIREEIEVALDDAAAGRALLESLGYRLMVSFEKRRERWRLSDCTVELDELPTLGSFVEVEGPGESAVREVLRAIGLGDASQERRGYVELVAELLGGAAPAVLRF